MRRNVIGLLFFLQPLVATATAAPSGETELEILPNTNVATIAPVLRNAGMLPETITVGDSDSLVVRSGDLAIILRPTVCRPDCAGLLMYTLFEGTSPASMMNSFNERTPPTAAYTTQGNTVLSRYLIADHGITAGSFMVNLVVFDNTVSKWLQDRGRNMAQSVGLADPAPETNFSRETEAFLSEVMARPELFSGQAQRQSY